MPTDGAVQPRHRRQLVWLVTALAVLLAIPVVAGVRVWLSREPSFPTVNASVLSPLPPGLERSSAGGFACPTNYEEGPSFGYTIIRGDDGQIGGLLAEHLRSIGFRVSESDAKWRGLVAERGDEKVVAGSSDDYLAGFSSRNHDPLAVADTVGNSETHAVVLLMAVGAECESTTS